MGDGGLSKRILTRRATYAFAVASLISTQLTSQVPPSPVPLPPSPVPSSQYFVFVASEGNDHIALLKFGPSGAVVDHDFRMGNNPTELVGPHGVGVSPNGKY